MVMYRLSELLLALPASKRKSTPLQFDSTFSTSTPARNSQKTTLLEPTSPSSSQAATQTQSQSQDTHPQRHEHAPPLKVYTGEGNKTQEMLEADQLTTATLYIQNKDYLRVAGVLKGCKSPAAAFMGFYSRLLVRDNTLWNTLC
jgi:hypothetical protein